MGKIGKIIAAIIGLIVILFVAALVLTQVYSEDVRAFVEQKVEEQTGRELTIGGDISISLFPWIGIELGAVELGNAPGFGPEPFASIQRADVRLKLMPLLKKQVEADTLVLDGLQLSLGRNAEGVSNWDDLTGTRAEVEPVPEEKKQDLGEVLAALNIGGVAISNASVLWDDRQAGQRVALDEVDLSIGALRLNQPFPLKLSMLVNSANPDMHGQVSLAAQVILDLDGQIYRLDGLELSTDLKSQLIPGGALASRLEADLLADLDRQTATLSKLQLDALGAQFGADISAVDILAMPSLEGSARLSISDGAKLLKALGGALPISAADLKTVSLDSKFKASLADQTLDIPQLRLNALGVVLSGEASGKRIIDSPTFSGKLASNEFVPRDIAARLGVVLPEMADPSALTKASLDVNFSAGLDDIGLNNLHVKFDDSTLKGRVALKQFTRPVIRYDLHLDAIDADRYLPPPLPAGAPVKTPEPAPVAGATELPLELLRGLDIDGTFHMGNLKVMNLHSNTIVATLKAKDGLFRLNPLGASLYEGTYSGNLAFDVRKAVPRLSMDEKLSGVQSGPLLQDFMGEPYVSGKANLSARMTAEGLEPMAIRKTLSGDAAFLFENGAVNGINLAQLIRGAYAALGKASAADDETKKTDFAELKGTVQISNGLVTNNDLSAKSPLFRITGSGTANLVSERLDYLVKPTIVGTLEGQGGKELSELKGLTIPVRVTGTFQKPDFKVELDKVLEAKAKAALDNKKQEAEAALEKRKQEIEEKAKSRIEEKTQDLQQQLRDKLKLKF